MLYRQKKNRKKWFSKSPSRDLDYTDKNRIATPTYPKVLERTTLHLTYLYINRTLIYKLHDLSRKRDQL